MADRAKPGPRQAFTRFAFTLAETLITLGIIGIVAALTMPALVANYQEKVTVARLKKFYSNVSNAYNLLQDENGPKSSWGLADIPLPQRADYVVDEFDKYLKFSKKCGAGLGCFPDVAYKHLRNTNHVNWEQDTERAKAILTDGTIIMFDVRDSVASGDTMQIYVDVNGFQGPNQLGKDFFYFDIRGDKITPRGNQFTDGDYFETNSARHLMQPVMAVQPG